MLRRTLCPVLIGREREMSALSTAFEAALDGEGAAVLVAGDAGIGKTRLAEELRLLAESRGAVCLGGGCSETGMRVPYMPFVEAIRGHLRQHPEAMEPGLDGLFGGAASGDDPAETRIRIFEAVARFLSNVSASHGTLLEIEDLHWSDSGTRDLLDYVVRSLPGTRLLVVGTYRADEVGRSHPLLPLVRGWERRGLASLVEIGPLSAAGVMAMLEATVGKSPVGLAQSLHARSEGNPFVLEEILKSDGGDPAGPLPATVSEAILRRVEKLEGSYLQVLRAAAVLGDPIDDRILTGLLGDQVPDALETCAREQLLTPSADGTYRWRHAITREAVYQQMAAERRRWLHSDLADACEASGADDVTLWRHLAAAGRWEEAIPRCRSAAAAAIAVGAFADAAQTLSLCLPHLGPDEERAEVLDEVADLLMQSGTPELGESYAREALTLRDAHGPQAAAAARKTLATCLWQQARWAEAIILEDRTIAELESLAPSPELVATLARRASWNMLAEGELDAAVRMVERARLIAEKEGFDPGLYRADTGQVLAAAGRLDEGLAILDDSWRSRLRASGMRDSGWREARFMLHHGVALRNLVGLTAESLAILAEHPPSARSQDAADFSLAVVQIDALWAHGEVGLALELSAALELGRVERSVVPWIQCQRCELLYSTGQLSAAAALARTAMPPHWQPTSQLRVAWEIRILLEAGDSEGALQLGSRVDRLRGFGLDFQLPLLDAAVEAHLGAGQMDAAKALEERAAGAAAAHPHRARIDGMMRLAQGDPRAARERLVAAASGFAARGHRQDEWHARRLAARALRASGDRRAAEEEFRQVDAETAAAGGVSPAAKPRLSRREREVALLVAQGLRNREIAARLFISERTVENHIHRVLERTGLRSRAELAAQVTRLGGELSGIPE